MMHRFGHHWMRGGHGFGPHWMPGSDGFGGWHSMLFSTLSTLFLMALCIGLAWALLQWVLPYLLPMRDGPFSSPLEGPSSLEILRRRYAEGAIDAVTFEQMRERLEASYQDDEPWASHWDQMPPRQ